MKLTATFSNGTTIKRRTERPYTHAWIVQYTTNENARSGAGHARMFKGFASSAGLAAKALASAESAVAGYGSVDHAEAVEVKVN